MARIRSIKPEFPQSQTMGKLSRDARLLFIQLWTLVDDEGRTRAASRMLASLLYPYDDDAPRLIGGWLDELECHGCIRRYVVDGDDYLDLPNWLKHQKIDRPSASKLPAFNGSIARAREDSRILDADLDLEGDLGSGRKNSDPDGSAPQAGAPADDEPDFRTALFRRGLKAVCKLTGKADPQARTAIGRWLRDCEDEAVVVLEAIDACVDSRPADPMAWITGAIRSRMQQRGPPRPRLVNSPPTIDQHGNPIHEPQRNRSTAAEFNADVLAGLFEADRALHR